MLIQQLVNGLMLGGIYVLIAVAFTLSIGILNFMNFSIPGLFMIGGVGFWFLLKSGVAWFPAFLIVLAVVAVIAIIVERFTYRWMKKSDHEIPLVSSLGFLILLENLVQLELGSEHYTMPALLPDMSLKIGGVLFGSAQLASLMIAIVLVLLLNYLLKKTQLGRSIRAISENTETAEILGIEVSRIVPLIFVIAGLLAALGGVLFAISYLQVHAFMGEEIGFKAISAMIIGGMGNVWGAILGGLLIGLTEVMSINFFGSSMVDISVYGLLLLLLIIRPQGLLGKAVQREKL